MDRCHSTDSFGDEQRHANAAAHGCPSWLCHQGAPGRGALCGLVCIKLGVHDGSILRTETVIFLYQKNTFSRLNEIFKVHI